MERNDVIKALKLHKTRSTHGGCSECPYDSIDECVDALIEDAAYYLQGPAADPRDLRGTAALLDETQDLLTETLEIVTATIGSMQRAIKQLRADTQGVNNG